MRALDAFPHEQGAMKSSRPIHRVSATVFSGFSLSDCPEEEVAERRSAVLHLRHRAGRVTILPSMLLGPSLAVLILACSGNNPVIERGSGDATGGTTGAAGTGGVYPSSSGGGTGDEVDLDETGGAGDGSQPDPPEEYCGNGTLVDEEECDDGNTKPGDGCSPQCVTEQFFDCPEPGKPCVSTIVCGDQEVAGIEACDDGNANSGDGCSGDCLTVEAGFTCPTAGGLGGPCEAVVEERCGDGRLAFGEGCDDGNDVDDDGCSNQCVVAEGYDCPQPGQRCQLIRWCGDGYQTGSEDCDDGSADGVPVGGDGCSAECTVEPDYACPNPGQPCISLVDCGDGVRAGSETCDDNNLESGDGCSETCSVEDGWECPVDAPCRPLACGDGIAVALEECDDGNPDEGDGCSSSCEVEEGYACEVGGGPCLATTCHDGAVEGTEQCEDGNYDTGDGCSPSCKFEPSCVDGVCEPVCGDGLKLDSEACDDGNTRTGDGCSDACEVEAGFTCEVELETPVLPIVYRDFIGTSRVGRTTVREGDNEDFVHPDFEQYLGGFGDCADEGESVEPLTTEGKPVLADANGCVDSAETFAQWYRSDPEVNRTIVDTITFSPVADTEGAYEFIDDAFWPLTGRGWNDPADLQEQTRPAQDSAGEDLDDPQNFFFTSELRYWFTYRGGERLTFYGDDDVWVFINGHLAVAIPGIHRQRERWIELPGETTEGGTGAPTENDADTTTLGYYTPEDLGIQLGGVYDVVVYQAERHTTMSQYRLTLQNFLSGRSRCAPVCGDGVVTRFEACDLGEANNTGEYGTCTPDCKLPPRCGDGQLQEEYEACDDGSNLTTYDANGGGCAPGCVRPSSCGDGVVDGAYGEVCDEGALNGTEGSGCTETCELAAFCGNGSVDPNEDCDDGPLNGTSSSQCTEECTPKCGNGVPDPGEECDDGASENTGGYGRCTPDCKLGPRCGDGIRNGSEECDDGVDENTGSYGGCNPDCTFAGFCGDGEVQVPAEECDQGDANVSTGYGEGLCLVASCSVAPYCGDGITQSEYDEQCDGGAKCSRSCRSSVQ